MRPELSCRTDNIVAFPLWARTRSGETAGHDETLAELRQLWPSAVDLAKQPGLLCRLSALLSN